MLKTLEIAYDEFLATEHSILHYFDFDLYQNTHWNFLELLKYQGVLVSREKDSMKSGGTAVGLAQLVDRVYERVDEFALLAQLTSHHKEFVLAAACIYAARKGSGLTPVWPHYLEIVT